MKGLISLRPKFNSILMFSENRFVELLDRIIETAKTRLDKGEKLVLISEPADDVITLFNDNAVRKLVDFCNEYPDQLLVYIVSINDLRLEGKHPQIKYIHFFDFHGSYYPMYQNIDFAQNPIKKRFLSLNKRGDVWRQLLYKMFWKKGYLNTSYFSFLCERGNYDHLYHVPTFLENQEFLDEWVKKYSRNLMGPWPEEMFIEIEGDAHLNAYKTESFATDPTWKLKPQWYEDTFCSVVIETSITKEYINFSEKTFKNIAAGQPMLLLGVAGTLQTLRRCGFDTFDDVFDNSYDDEIDDNVRVVKFLQSIDKIANMEMRDLTLLKRELKPRLEKNKQVYKEMFLRYKQLNASIPVDVEKDIRDFLKD